MLTSWTLCKHSSLKQHQMVQRLSTKTRTADTHILRARRVNKGVTDHWSDGVNREVGCLGIAVRNKPNKVLRAGTDWLFGGAESLQSNFYSWVWLKNICRTHYVGRLYYWLTERGRRKFWEPKLWGSLGKPKHWKKNFKFFF